MKVLNHKQIVQRTCIACRQVKSKRELIRLVHSPAGIAIDESGRKEGRGAYLCRSLRCWETALKTNRVEHALKSSLNVEDLERLQGFKNTLQQE